MPNINDILLQRYFAEHAPHMGPTPVGAGLLGGPSAHIGPHPEPHIGPAPKMGGNPFLKLPWNFAGQSDQPTPTIPNMQPMASHGSNVQMPLMPSHLVDEALDTPTQQPLNASTSELPFQTYERVTGQHWTGGKSSGIIEMLKKLGIGAHPGSSAANLALQNALRNGLPKSSTDVTPSPVITAPGYDDY